MATPKHVLTQMMSDPQPATQIHLNDLEKRLLNEFQRGLPLTPRPFAAIAEKLGTHEALVVEILNRLQDAGVISRVGPVFKPKKIGTSTLAAMAIPEERLEEIAEVVNAYPEVNHNYERSDHFNLWFVATASTEEQLDAVLNSIRLKTGFEVLKLPMEKQFHIDLGFPLWC
ncbi:MAG: Lrp/AsnC family transcriptional regulator [Chromatiales bacterium]|nr:Lrp/AsnC family transcriptional regulator [Chromatiales bacterium]